VFTGKETLLGERLLAKLGRLDRKGITGAKKRGKLFGRGCAEKRKGDAKERKKLETFGAVKHRANWTLLKSKPKERGEGKRTSSSAI